MILQFDVARAWHTQDNTPAFPHFLSHASLCLSLSLCCGVQSYKFSLLTFSSAMCRVQILIILILHWVCTTQALDIQYLSQLLSKILGSKVVNERIEAAIQAAETEREFVGHVERLMIEESRHSVSQQEDIVGSKAEGEDQENNDGQTYRSLFLGCLRISGQFAYDTDIAECRDAEREEEEDEDHAEEKRRPGWQRRQHVFLQHVKACRNPKFRKLKGQVCRHQRVQNAQDQTPHEEAADDSDGFPPRGLPEQQWPDDAQVAVNSDGHHGQDGTVHIGVEDEGQETVDGYIEEEYFI